MPLYDYECRNCGHIVEVLHGVNASGPTACEQCGGPMRKLMSTPSIVFKGSGWAKKDARDARPKAAKSTSSSGAKDESSGSSSSSASGSSGSGSEGDSGSGKAAAEQAKSGDGAAKQGGTKESSASAAPD